MSDVSVRTPELLAPAGGLDALRAAVASGADAVYLGVDRLNARRGADNFTLETLAEACRFAHLRGVRVYLTANVVVLPHEIADALSMIDRAWAAGVDGVIVQDLGLLRCIRTQLPHVRIHISTQVNAHSARTIRVLSGRGAARVTLAREVSVAEISTWVPVAERAGAQLESFVHGAICVCYSGQCLMSSLIGGRSANRGMCAQPCRLTYELVDAAGKAHEVPGAHLLSPKDLAGITLLPDLVASGVASLKIEGRMKSADYVAIVTGVYRHALDRAAGAAGTYAVRDGEVAALAEAFNRGFTEAYLGGERGNPMMSYTRPNNRGVLVGRIASVAGLDATVVLETGLSAEDTLEVWTGRGRFAQPAGPLTVGESVGDIAPAGARVRIRLAEPAAAGDRVFRVRNASLSAAAARTYRDAEGVRLPVDVAVRVEVGHPVEVTLTDEQGRTGSGSGSVVEAARTRSVSAAEVTEHVGRFGATPFEPRSWDVALSPNVGIGFSELHRVRREAAEALERAVLAPWHDRAETDPAPPLLTVTGRRPSAPSLVVGVETLEAALACLAVGADQAQVPASALDGPVPRGVVPVLPRIAHDAQEDAALSVVVPDALVVAGTLGLLAEAVARGARAQAHWSLNAVNAHSVAELAEIGAELVWLSPELSSHQLLAVAREAAVDVGFAIAGRQELMVTEHCVLMSAGECSQRCGSCARRRSPHTLRDRKGYEFPVRTDVFGRTHLYNAVPLDLTAALPELLAAGVSALRIDADTLTTEQAVAEVRRVRTALDAALNGATIPVPRDRGTTTAGHFFRGVS